MVAGDAVASDTIYQAVQFARHYKPIVASFSDVAASGGYYAAAAADMIISNNYTITGSIGVIMGYPVIKRLLEKIDISTDAIEFIPNAAWHHPELGNMPASELEKLSRHVDATYERFKNVVAEGRNMSVDDVEKVAQGQVFTGSQAQNLGLVDKTGTLDDALLMAALLSLERLKVAEKPGGDELETADTVFQGAVDAQIVIGRIKELAKGDQEPTDEEILELIKSAHYEIRPVISVTTIPHVNPANEALGYAISSAFASDEERSPVPIDLPLPEPEDGDEVPRSRVVLGALLGLAKTNDIPLWQFPLFCYWYAGQAAGRMGEGVVGNGLLDRMFAGVFGGRELDVAVRRVAGGRPPLFNEARGLGMDIRMEMMPLQLYF
jgi:signal peptide peptidase SppA